MKPHASCEHRPLAADVCNPPPSPHRAGHGQTSILDLSKKKPTETTLRLALSILRLAEKPAN